jgi:hypothetical protein
MAHLAWLGVNDNSIRKRWTRHRRKMGNARFLNVVFGCVFGAYLATASAASANLLVNGSFEEPTVPGSSSCGPYSNCLGFNVGDNIAGWTVVGKGGAPGVPVVMSLGSNYTEPDNSGNNATLHFYPVHGAQSLDLTGEGNQGLTNGIKQSVTTIAGDLYELSFFVGNQYDQAPGYAGASSIVLYIDGIAVETLTNPDNTAENVNWMQFVYDFTALTNVTTIAFLNGTGVGNNYAGLDNVVFAPLNITVPEPGTLALFLGGLGALSVLRRRKTGQRA